MPLVQFRFRILLLRDKSLYFKVLSTKKELILKKTVLKSVFQGIVNHKSILFLQIISTIIYFLRGIINSIWRTVIGKFESI